MQSGSIATLLFGGLWATTVSGFVLPKAALTTKTVQHLPPTTTSLFAARGGGGGEENGLVLIKQGLKWMLVPNSKSAYVPEPVVSSSSSSSSSVVDATDLSSLLSSSSVSSANDAVSAVATEASTPPPPVSPEAVLSTVVDSATVLQEQALQLPPPPPPPPMLQILPQTDGTLPTTSALDFEKVVQAVRDNHWAHMPHIQDAVQANGRAPLLIDILEVRGGLYEKETEDFLRQGAGQIVQGMVHNTETALQDSGVKLAHAMETVLGATESYWRESGSQYSQLVQTTDHFLHEAAQEISQTSTTLTMRIDPNLFQALQEKIQSADTQSMTLQELKDFFALDQIKIDPASLAAATSWTDFTASLAAVKATLGQDVITWDDVVNAMNLKETGTWYFASAFLVILFSLSLGAGGANKNQKIILTEAAMPLSDNASSSSASVTLVSEELVKLKDATNAMYAQLNEMNKEKSTRAYELATLKSDLRSVTNRLDATIAEERQLRMALEATQAKLQKETSSLQEQLHQRVAAEDQLRQELAETQKKLADEARKVQLAKKESEQQVLAAEAQVKKLEEEKDEMEDELVALRKEVETLKQRLADSKMNDEENDKDQDEDDDEEDIAVAEKELVVSGSSSSKHSSPVLNGGSDGGMERARTAVAHQQAARGQASPSRATTLPSTSSAYDKYAKSVYFATMVDPNAAQSTTTIKAGVRPVQKAESTSGTPVRKRVVKKILVKKVVSRKLDDDTTQSSSSPTSSLSSSSSVENMDWSTLSESTLKRKTVKELSQYLESKGAPTIGSDGKALKKDDLVQTVLSQ
ncbi:hypothetical protein ACA910_015898 [Epithemia clementina (nom. ined.)]